MLIANNGAGSNHGIVKSVDLDARTIAAAYYEGGGQAFGAGVQSTLFVYGSDFAQGTEGMEGSIEASFDSFTNMPVIHKGKYEVAGSKIPQIGWLEATWEGGSGFFWYLKSLNEERLRFEDYLETLCLEAVPAETGSGVADQTANANLGKQGTEGLFYVINNRGNVWGGGHPTSIAAWDTVEGRLDKQGGIEENLIFCDRKMANDLSDMLASQNSYGAGGTSYGLFNNSKEMSLNLGFQGWRRGYDYYVSLWKYAIDPTMRGNLPEVEGSGKIDGIMVPGGSKSIYDKMLGTTMKLPFLHVRYRMADGENRRYKEWPIGSAGGPSNSSKDSLAVHFLSERALVTLGAVNFFLFNR
jgi:hypothetical protein